ncbi:JAB domain-containing protein [Lysobacter sp. A3-1-A15]|uniref:JAB domain-containing protein n=1 Tax=Novilysobacter viscosus TaxID=3098602 RepID=UPI002ED97ED9
MLALTNRAYPDRNVSEKEQRLIARAVAVLQRRMVGGEPLSSPDAAGEFLRLRLAPLDREVFFLLLLDTRHRVVAAEMVFMGTIDGAEVHPRIVARLALKHNAAAVICAHNHPSQNPEPSAADRAVTARLKQALALLDIRLLDHFVVTAAGCTSLAARGWV